MSDNGWNEWSRHVLAELQRLNTCYGTVNDQLQKIHVEIATLKVKSGMWGLIGGSIPVLITVMVYLMTKQ